jgi:hypothetical protein
VSISLQTVLSIPACRAAFEVARIGFLAAAPKFVPTSIALLTDAFAAGERAAWATYDEMLAEEQKSASDK